MIPLLVISIYMLGIGLCSLLLKSSKDACSVFREDDDIIITSAFWPLILSIFIILSPIYISGLIGIKIKKILLRKDSLGENQNEQSIN
jgi:hypothetical protein